MMRSLLFTMGTILVLSTCTLLADPPELQTPVVIEDGGVPINVVWCSCPGVVDWNNDGLFDLLVGEHSGKVNLLINGGTVSQPLFPAKEYIKDGFGDLKESMRCSPEVADWNGDGKKDLLVGEEFGHLYYYENKNTDALPVFNGKVEVMAGGRDFDHWLYCRTRIDVTDWDEDGVLDIIAGQGYQAAGNDTNVFYFHGTGPLALDTNQIPASTGGTVNFTLEAGAAYGNRNYFLLGSASGTTPGLPLPGGQATLPLNWDAFTDLVLVLANTAVFPSIQGAFDGGGSASAQMNALKPLPSSVVGLHLHFAYLLYNPYDLVSNAAGIEIIP